MTRDSILSLISSTAAKLKAHRRAHGETSYLQRRLNLLKAWLIALETKQERAS